MAAERAETVSVRRVLLVEGPEDRYVFFHLAGRHGPVGQFTVFACEGIEAAFDSLETRLLAENEEALGIAVDVDGSIRPDAVQRRWARFQAILRAAGYSVIPEHPHP